VRDLLLIIIVPEENGYGAQERTIVECNGKERGEEAGGDIYKKNIQTVDE
jgi:hypothetical protein